MEVEIKNHWENIYGTKQANEVSWTQEIPKTSLEFIHSYNLPKSAAIIDIGGGDSKLVDYLLDEGYSNITVLDISEKAIEKAKYRLGNNAGKVNWIVSDILDFHPEEKFDIWHDRAAFHFMVTNDQIEKYLSIARNSLDGYLTIGTFSVDGPKKCSGLEIKQYDASHLEAQLAKGFSKIRCVTEDHVTPFNTVQNFIFCSFKKAS
jgi:SAM-dependent methyltransferase